MFISGGSGSGKSSINALLLRYYDPSKGKVTYDGQGMSNSRTRRRMQTYSRADIREFNTTSWRSVIGVVPQVSRFKILSQVVSNCQCRILSFLRVRSHPILHTVIQVQPGRKSKLRLGKLTASLSGVCRRVSIQKVCRFSYPTLTTLIYVF